MSDDKQKPRERIRIPTPKELDESATGGQSEQDEPQEQKGGRARFRRIRMRMRGGVGRNKNVLKAPRPDVETVGEGPPDGKDPGDVEPGFIAPLSERVIGDEGGQILEEAVPLRQIPGRIQSFKDEFSEEDKQEGSSRSRVRTVKFSPKIKKRKEEPVLVPEETPKKLTLEERARAEARAHAEEMGHEMGDFVEKPRFSNDRVFIAICKKCDLNINGEVLYNYKVGLVRVSGKAKNKRCTGEAGGYSSGTS